MRRCNGVSPLGGACGAEFDGPGTCKGRGRHAQPPISHAEMKELGWSRVDPRPWRKTWAR